MKFTKIKIVMSALLVSLVLSACSKQNNDDVSSSKETIQIKTNLKNVDAVFYKNRSTNYAIQFIAVSNVKLNEKDISFKSDSTIPITFSMEEDSDMKSDFYDCLVSKKLDWKGIAKVMLSDNMNEQAKVGEELDSYRDEYLKSEMGMKDYYVYTFTLNFDITPEIYNENSSVKEIVMNVKDEKFTLSLGDIEFLKYEDKYDSNALKQMNALGRVGKKVIPTYDKEYQEDIEDWQFEALNDFKIQKIESLQKNISIEKTRIKIMKSDGSEIEKVFKDNDINLSMKKGDKFSINPSFKGQKSNDIIYHQTYNYELDIMNNNKEESIIVESGILSSTDTAYKILHEQDLLNEYLSYYNDYAKFAVDN